jgi:peptidoglycan hydrolase-like protein with peptidoglycan-binding domain
MLNALGYKPGPADGIMGRNTRIALQAFRKDNNLPPNRSVGVDLARLFKAGASVDKKTDNNQSCASVMVTKHVRATPPVKSLPKSKPNKPRATTPKCEFPSIFSPTIGRCINVLKLLPKRGDNGLILRK